MEVAGATELRTLKLVAEPDDIETRSTIWEILKAKLDLPEKGVCSVRVSIGAKEPTTIEVKYYHLVDGGKVVGVSP